MSATQSRTYETPNGEKAEISKLDALAGGGARIAIDVDDGPRWRLDVNNTGEDYDLVTAWNADDQLADIDVPEWIDELLLRLQRR